MDVSAGFVVRFLFSVLVNPAVACTHADNFIAFVDQIRSGKSAENVNPFILGLFSEPAGEFPDGGHIAAVMSHGRRNVGKRQFLFFGKVIHPLFGHFRLKGNIKISIIWKEFGDGPRINDGAG